MFYVYILKSKKDNNLYTGFSQNLRERLKWHAEGRSQATKWRLPIELVYYEAYKDKTDARKREMFLKSGRGREIIKKQIENSLK
ncbi:MAG TPA: GIY-YIG nuclease family protein [Clostridia bacterium]|nr:GIY-YIG nuclease family protein [Clostridia bacterium]